MTEREYSLSSGGGTRTLTDNDHVASKVALRVEAIEMLGDPREIRVIDAYHGHGRLWQLVEEALPEGWTVKMYRADRETRAAGTLKVDNLRLLQAIDLTRFDIIDLDAYGYPAYQLRVVAARAPGKLVLSTRIAKAMGRIPKCVLEDLGFRLPKGAPGTLITTIADELWEAWCCQLGYGSSRLLRFDHGHHVKRYETLIPKTSRYPNPSPSVARDATLSSNVDRGGTSWKAHGSAGRNTHGIRQQDARRSAQVATTVTPK